MTKRTLFILSITILWSIAAKSNHLTDDSCPVYPQTVSLKINGEYPAIVQKALQNLDQYLQSEVKQLDLPGFPFYFEIFY